MPPANELTWLQGASRPSRYLGNEINIVCKPPESVEMTIVLAFPDVYEVGMSHLGLKILYDILNTLPWLAAERAFAPWPDMEEMLRRQRLPLSTLESRRPLDGCDIIGFSIQHELCLTNVLNMLDLSNIPPLASQRRAGRTPLIIAGGPACFNPEPMADFFDLIVVGDGEIIAPAICQTVRDWKKRGTESRQDLLKHLSSLEGVYIPAFFRPRYGKNGMLEGIDPLLAGYNTVRKAIVPSIEEIPYPHRQLVPFTELIHDRLAIEVARGCTRGCRFCQAGMIYRPVRERHPSTVAGLAHKALKATGYDDLSLLSLSTGDYSCIEPLLIHLMNLHEKEKVAVSLPSLRVDSLSPLFMEQIQRVRKTGFTLALEAGNERLRRVINKGLSHEEILRTVERVYRAGWNLIKLYCMIGLPFETDEDLSDMVETAKEIASLGSRISRRNRLNLSVSTFVPKSHTPFMWCAQLSLEESRRRLHFVQEKLRRGPIKVKWNQPEMSWLEGVFSRGDRRLAAAVLSAWRKGARFDAWAEHFQPELWSEAFEETGVDPRFYAQRTRDLDEVLPWDHISSGVTKAFLRSEWERACQALPTPDCRNGCLDCGVCDHLVIDPVLAGDWSPPAPAPVAPSADPGQPARYIISYSKTGSAALLGHMEFSRAFLRAFRRSGIKLKYSQGFHPLPKVTFTSALPLGTESLAETLLIEVESALNVSKARQDLNNELPAGIRISDMEPLALGTRIPRLESSLYNIHAAGLERTADRIALFLAEVNFPVVKTTKKGEHVLDIRPLVPKFRFLGEDTLELEILHPEGPQIRPLEVIKAVFELNDSEVANLRIRKVAQVLTW